MSSAAEEAAPAPSPRAAELAALHPQRAALELAWPGIVENSIAAAGQATIFAFVGHLGAVSTAAVGAAFQFLFLMFPIWRSLSIGTVAHVSRRMGEGRASQASDVARQSITLGAISGIAFGVGFVVFASPLLRLLGADEEVVSVASPILALVGAGSVFQTVWFIATSAIRAAGDSRTPMWLAILSVFVTVPLAFLFIDVLHVGAIGAGYAVVTNSAIVCVISLYVLWVGRADLTIRGGKWGLDAGVIRSLFAISLPSAAESTLFSVGILALSGFAFRLGTASSAAHQIVNQVESFSFLPCIGFAGAASALVGQALGMNDPRRAVRSGWAAVRMALLWSTAAGVVFMVVPRFLLGVFTNDQGVIDAGVGALTVIGIGQPAQAVIFTLGGALRGSGDTRFPLIATIVNWFVVRLPLAYVLAFPLGLGLTGVWAGIAADYFVRAGLLAWRFNSGAWQRVRV
ncbi:MAG TPA: MATE family efflux transporter [Candidatus Polarisedimenticolia bacterium]|nr:MATE family efflux transporter [Candidatus Polarisedimenticolia bacterium]